MSGGLGVSPGTAVTGMPPARAGGTINVGADAATAHSDLERTYTDAAGRVRQAIFAPDVGATTLTAGGLPREQQPWLTGTVNPCIATIA